MQAALDETMARAFAKHATGADQHGDFSTDGLAASTTTETPERRAMKALYARMPELPPSLQMLMAGCPAELEERRHRIGCREIVSRNLWALSTGVRRTVCWHLAPEIAGYEDPLTMMELLQGKLLLLRHDDAGRLTRWEPAGHTFRLLADHLDGATAVSRIALEEHPELSAFRVDRPGRAPLLVLWRDGDLFSGEDEPPTAVELPWPHDHAVGLDALGAEHACELHDGLLTLEVSVTPVFLSTPSRTTRRDREASGGSNRLETRLGPLAWRSAGHGPAVVFFAGALANGELWRDVVAALQDRYRCITIDLPLGAHPWPLQSGADRSAGSLGRLLIDTLELLDVQDATVVANDTAGGLVLLSLSTGHPALERVGRLVLTNCESYDKFPPDPLKGASALCRRFPRVSRGVLGLQARSSAARRRGIATVTASGLDQEREESFFGAIRSDGRVADDLVAAMAGFRPQILLDAADAIPQFDRPVLLIWGDSCDFFPIADAERLAADFPDARLIPVPGAKTWVPVDDPAAVSDAIVDFVPPYCGAGASTASISVVGSSAER